MTNSKRRNSRHDRYDREFLSVSNLLNSVKGNITEVVNKRQVIVNKALAMTHRTLTNGKEFRQLQSVIRQVTMLQNNIPFVKEAPYLLVVAPKGFLSHMNRLIESCNHYIDETPLLRLGNIEKMEYLPSDIDLKGILFYDRKGVNSMWTEKESMISITKEAPVITKEITTVHELKQIQSNTTHQLEDIL